jgi:hypothetical protein
MTPARPQCGRANSARTRSRGYYKAKWLKQKLKKGIGAEGETRTTFVLRGFSLLSQNPNKIALFASAFFAPFAFSAFCCALVVTGSHSPLEILGAKNTGTIY